MPPSQSPRFHLSNAWIPTAFLTGAGFLCGIATSAVFMLGVESERIEKLQNDLIRSSATIDGLRHAQSSLGFALAVPVANLPDLGHGMPPAPVLPATASEPTLAAQVVPQSAPTATPAATTPPPPQAPPKPATPAAKMQAKPAPAPASIQKPLPAEKHAKDKPTDVKPAAPATTRSAGMDLPLPESSSAPAGSRTAETVKAPTPVHESEIKTAIDKNSIEMAPKSKMGVDKIEAGAVVMASGTKVQVGDRFNSGEKLLSVDHETGRIVTDRRTVMITP